MKGRAFLITLMSLTALLLTSLDAVSSDSKPGARVVSGKVLDAITGEELTGVCIRVTGSDLVTYSEADGSFEIDMSLVTVENGQFELQLTLVSFEPKTIVLTSGASFGSSVVSLHEK